MGVRESLKTERPDIIVLRVQAPDIGLRALRVVRRAGRSQRRHLLQLRPAEPQPVGFAPALRALGTDLGFVPFVIGTCVVLYVLTLVFSAGNVGMGGLLSILAPKQPGAVPVRRQRGHSGVRRRTAGGRSSARAGCTAASCTSSST